MGYVEELRALVGSRALVLASVSVIICDANERVLLARRADDGQWDLPGGSLEPGETLEDTARREIREELGVDLGRLELLDVRSGPEVSHVYPNGDRVEGIVAVYVADHVSGELRPDPAEVSQVAFFDPHAAPSDMHAFTRTVLGVLSNR